MHSRVQGSSTEVCEMPSEYVCLYMYCRAIVLNTLQYNKIFLECNLCNVHERWKMKSCGDISFQVQF